jgi:hypothetical protein
MGMGYNKKTVGNRLWVKEKEHGGNDRNDQKAVINNPWAMIKKCRSDSFTTGIIKEAIWKSSKESGT